MKIHDLHDWDISCRQAVALQKELSSSLILNDQDLPAPVKTVAGADISYATRSDLFFASVVLFDYPSLKIIEETSHIERVTFPYVPGLLSFREGPPLLAAFAKLKRKPDIAIFDGHGISHPRGIGLASHMGLFLDIPTIGCAKQRLVGSHGEIGEEIGASAELLLGDRIVGAVLRTKNRVKPVFVSQGHRISLERAVSVVLSCCAGYRLPEPTRKAHLAVNQMRISHGPGITSR